MKAGHPRRLDTSEKWFALLLRLYPVHFRRRFEPEMFELFRERRAAARTIPSRARLWVSIVLDALRASLRERAPHPRWNLEMAMQDVKHAWRGLRRAPAAPFFIVLLIAIGIGSTTAVFSIVHGVLLRPFPFGEPVGATYNAFAPLVGASLGVEVGEGAGFAVVVAVGIAAETACPLELIEAEETKTKKQTEMTSFFLKFGNRFNINTPKI